MNENNWFETWFDSPLYEALYAHRDENDAQKLVQLISAYAPADQYPNMLDLACGRGRHSINFAEAGYQVTGVDLSESAIQKAREKASSRHLDIDFKTGDMRHPLPQKFDIIVNLFTSFGYFQDDAENEQVLEAISQMLKPDGIFWIDFLNAEKIIHDLVPFDEGEIPGWKYANRRWIEDGAVHKEISLISAEGNTKVGFSEYVKLLKKNWFLTVSKKNGFKMQHLFGNYYGDEYDARNSNRIIIGFVRV